MKILIDIVHMADVNFYKNAYAYFKKNGHEVHITVMNRGNLAKVAKDEFGQTTVIGKHCRANFLLKAACNLQRVALLRRYIRRLKPDVVTSFSYYPAAAAKGLGIKSVIFHDDPEYRIQFALCRFFAGKLLVPDQADVSGNNIIRIRSYKEMAYLGKGVFKPDASILKKFGLQEKSYYFIRDVSPVSLNYKDVSHFNYPSVLKSILRRHKAVVSLEDKRRKHEFPGCIMLEEPVKSFHSLVYYSSAVITSGDTMAREAAVLGVPAYYTGKRMMAVNRKLIEMGLITIIDSEENLINELKTMRRITGDVIAEDMNQIIIREVTA
jgi:uncharacterized protein